MSETLSSPVEFDHRISAEEAMEAVDREGAIAIHNFLPANELGRASIVLANAPMITDNSPNATVARRQDLIRYAYTHNQPWSPQLAGMEIPPEPIFAIARQIDEYVGSDSNSNWRPNEIMGHRYNYGDYINRHKDETDKALKRVTLLTTKGHQEFYFQRDNGEIANITMLPGTLTIMRGAEPGSDKQRPYHWVAPAQVQRLAVSLRQIRVGWD